MTNVGLRERKRVDTRNRIVTAAANLFRQRGLDEVTVDEIAAAADVGKGTVYNYFEAKEDIVVALVVELDRAALATIGELPRQGMSVAEALDAALWRMIDNKAEHLPYVRVALSRIFAADVPAPELSEFSDQFDLVLAALFERLLARPGMKRALPVDTLVLSFRSMHLGLSAGWALEGPPYATARMLSRRHMALLAKGLEIR
jgi:AcrR family transcriptional regulator